MNIDALTMSALFEQLGLDHSPDAMKQFLRNHSPLPDNIALHKATFWNLSQATFLQQAITLDSEWCYLADELDLLLR